MRRTSWLYLVAASAAALALVATAAGQSPEARGGRCYAPGTAATIGGHAVCLTVGAPCRTRYERQYHRFLYTCRSGALALYWPGLIGRPIHIPTLVAGSPCPTSEAHGTLGERGNIDVPDAPAFGPGPAYPTLRSDAGHAVLWYRVGWGYDGWDGTKLLWTVPRYRGPYIVRGRQIDGPNELRFDQGPQWSRKLHGELRLVGSYPRLNPAATFLRAPGCYAFQVDGLGFSYLIVFEAKISE